MEEKFNRDELNEISMQVILHAGNARENIFEVMSELANTQPDFETISNELKAAHKELTEAHSHQTNMIQKEANGEFIPFSVLFSHAQDTLMTVQSELNLVEKLVPIIKRTGGLNNA